MKKYIILLSIFILCGGTELTEKPLITRTDTDQDKATTITAEDITTTAPEAITP